MSKVLAYVVLVGRSFAEKLFPTVNNTGKIMVTMFIPRINSLCLQCALALAVLLSAVWLDVFALKWARTRLSQKISQSQLPEKVSRFAKPLLIFLRFGKVSRKYSRNKIICEELIHTL